MRLILPDESDLQAQVFLDSETFHSTFLARPESSLTRAIGRMTLLQRVPTTGVGGMVQWSKPVSTRHLFTAGADFRHVDGESQERALDATTGQTRHAGSRVRRQADEHRERSSRGSSGRCRSCRSR